MALSDLFRRKALADVVADAEHPDTGLKRTLGAFDLAMLGIGAIVGAGLFSSIGDMAAGASGMKGGGPAIMVSFLLTALSCGFAALCYAEIAAMAPAAGSAYTYSYAAFGELIAWIIGWDLIIEYAIGNVYVAASWSDHLTTLVRNLTADPNVPGSGFMLPTWLRHDMRTLALHPELAEGAPRLGSYAFGINLPAIAITVALTVLLYIGVRESARFNAVMVVTKVALVAAFVSIGIFHVDPDNWTPFAPNGFTGIWQAAALGFFSYIGFDAVSTASEETRNPQKNIPRGMIWSLVICTGLYVATAAVATGLVPYQQLAETQDPLAHAFQRIGMTGAATMFAFGAVVAVTAVLLVFQLGQTRIFMAMARDGLLPKAFAKIHPRFRTPHVGTIITGLIVVVGCCVLDPDTAITLCNIGTLFAFILVAIGVIVLRIREPDRPRPFRVPGYPVTPVLAILACLGLAFGLEHQNWARLGWWLLAGLVVYSAYGFWHSRLRAKPR